MWGSEEDEVLAGMKKLFSNEEDMDCCAIVEEEEEEEEDLTIQTVGKRVVLKNWTAAPSRAHRVPGIIITYPDEPVTVTCNETMQHKDSDSEDLEDDTIHEEIVREVENFENKPKSNLDKTEAVNIGDSELVKETRISIYLSPSEKEEYIRFLKEYEDIFAGSYDDMMGLSTSIVDHKLPMNPTCQMVKQKLRKFKSYISLKIKEEITKQIKAKVLRVVEYNLKLNPANCAFGVPAEIELDPSKVKAIQDLPPLKKKKDVMSFLGRLNYISRFITQSTVICEPIFKILRKDVAISWTEEYQKAFDKIKEYLSKPPVLVPPEPERPLLFYLSVLDGDFEGGQRASIGGSSCRKSRRPRIRTIENLDEEVSFVVKDITEVYDGWRMFFDGAVNLKGVGIRAILVSETGQHYSVSAKLKFPCTNNMAEYEACILGLRLAIDMNV
ncbi:uncharacterized protein [Nicotiana tomentosiformis]|uniref:uncharacterized protein n=1 Tax=Nicotiana tomentosiformis TaxID=4098 RepID=UPI00388C6920